MTPEARPGRFSEPLPLEVPEHLELVRVRIPLVEPFATAHGVERDRDLVLVHAVAADGVEGWGECSTLSHPGYSPEHTPAAWTVLRDELAPAVLEGRSAPSARANPMAMAGLEVACVDLAHRRLGRSLTAELGPGVERVPVGTVVGVASSVDELLAVVERRLREGYAQVKLKVTPGWLLEPLRAVRRAWPDLVLAADANGSLGEWLEGVAPPDLAELDGLGLSYLEQPSTPGRLAGDASLLGSLDTPIALDESIPDAAAFHEAVGAMSGAPFVVNVKLARLGGLRATIEVLHHIAGAGCSAFVGGMLESGVGRAAAVAVATSPVCNLVGDLGPSGRYFARDVITEPFVLRGGTVAVPAGAGIGVDVDLSAVEAFAVDRATIAR